MIRVMVVDDHPIVRGGLVQLLEAAGDIDVVGAFASAREALEGLAHAGPDVVLMDVSMPGLDGIAATREVLRRRPATRVVMLTSYADDSMVLSALDAGASGYLLKEAEPEEVIRGVRAAARGEAPLDPRAARVVLGARRDPQVPSEPLTPREVEILSLVAGGLANKQIAHRLGISEKTVKAHLTAIFQRLGVSGRTEAAIWARDHNLRS